MPPFENVREIAEFQLASRSWRIGCETASLVSIVTAEIPMGHEKLFHKASHKRASQRIGQFQIPELIANQTCYRPGQENAGRNSFTDERPTFVKDRAKNTLYRLSGQMRSAALPRERIGRAARRTLRTLHISDDVPWQLENPKGRLPEPPWNSQTARTIHRPKEKCNPSSMKTLSS